MTAKMMTDTLSSMMEISMERYRSIYSNDIYDVWALQLNIHGKSLSYEIEMYDEIADLLILIWTCKPYYQKPDTYDNLEYERILICDKSGKILTREDAFKQLPNYDGMSEYPRQLMIATMERLKTPEVYYPWGKPRKSHTSRKYHG